MTISLSERLDSHKPGPEKGVHIITQTRTTSGGQDNIAQQTPYVRLVEMGESSDCSFYEASQRCKGMLADLAHGPGR
jgi:hypothetical protein